MRASPQFRRKQQTKHSFRNLNPRRQLMRYSTLPLRLVHKRATEARNSKSHNLSIISCEIVMHVVGERTLYIHEICRWPHSIISGIIYQTNRTRFTVIIHHLHHNCVLRPVISLGHLLFLHRCLFSVSFHSFSLCFVSVFLVFNECRLLFDVFSIAPNCMLRTECMDAKKPQNGIFCCIPFELCVLHISH